MSITLDTGRAVLRPTTDTTHQSSSNMAASDEVPLGPVQRLIAKEKSFENRDVSLLLALALAEGTRELTKMQREASRLLVSGRTALLTEMIRAEPKLAALLEDVEFIKNMATYSVQIGMSAASAGKAEIKLPKKLQMKNLSKQAATAQRQQMLNKVYGDKPTPQQAKLFDQAVVLNKGHGDMYYGQLVKRGPMSKGKLVEMLKKHRPFKKYGDLTFDNPDGKKLIDAIEKGDIDPSELTHPDKSPEITSAIISHLNQRWDDGWKKDEAEVSEGVHGIREVEQQLLDVWHARMLEARLDLIRWSGRFADVFADVAAIAMGIDD